MIPIPPAHDCLIAAGTATTIFTTLCFVHGVQAAIAAWTTRERMDETIAIKWAVIHGCLALATGLGTYLSHLVA